MAHLTEAAIQDTFLKLLSEQPFDKITVTQLVDECQITRRTFYYHYSDLYELLDTIMRRETERPEAVQAGTVKLAGVAYGQIVALADQLLGDPAAYAAMAHAVNPYGDGQACRRIADAIEWHFGLREQPPQAFGG